MTMMTTVAEDESRNYLLQDLAKIRTGKAMGLVKAVFCRPTGMVVVDVGDRFETALSLGL
jgi:hypothetical protein